MKYGTFLVFRIHKSSRLHSAFWKNCVQLIRWVQGILGADIVWLKLVVLSRDEIRLFPRLRRSYPHPYSHLISSIRSRQKASDCLRFSVISRRDNDAGFLSV